MTREEYNFYYSYKGDIEFANNEELLKKIEKGIKEKEISMKYRKKPITVEAIQWNEFNLEEIKKFVGNPLIYEVVDGAWKLGKGRLIVEMKIKTLEGEMQVSEGDYIIKGIKGEFYPCKPDIFKQTYEQVENEPKTNFDRITSSVESLVEWVYSQYGCSPPDMPCKDTGCKKPNCKECFKEWLQKECEG